MAAPGVPEIAALGMVSHRIAMDTLVTIETVSTDPSEVIAAKVERAFGWFQEVEARCSRFDPASELSRLCDRPGTPVPVSDLLFNAVSFALAVAADSDGAFDPTVGDALVRRGFDRNYRTEARVGERTRRNVSFRDIVLNRATKEVTLLRPLTLDLGAVAKGMAIDLAARELDGLPGFAINAGGDIYAAGADSKGRPWVIGIRDPREFDALAETVTASGMAVCTSGDYERNAGREADHHILEPGSGRPAPAVASVTVVARSAMLADALATAAFVLGPERGLAMLEAQGVNGLIITPAGQRFETEHFKEFTR